MIPTYSLTHFYLPVVGNPVEMEGELQLWAAVAALANLEPVALESDSPYWMVAW